MSGESQWNEFDHLLEHYPASIMLWEDDPLPEVKNILAEKNIRVVIFNPVGNQPDEGDFLEIMKENITNLEGKDKNEIN